MRGSLGLGLVIGLVMGAGAMYLVLRPPWGGGAAAPSDAGAIAASGGDAGSAKPKKKHGGGHRRPGGGGAGQTVAGGNEDQQWANQGDGPDEPEGPAPVQLSAADRALEWQGDDVSPPPRKIDMESSARPLDDGEIRSAISSQSGPAQQCAVQAASAVNAAISATITVKLVVDDKGHVSRSKIQAPHYLFGHGLLPCIKGALGRMKFPATGMPTLVTLPINLT